MACQFADLLSQLQTLWIKNRVHGDVRLANIIFNQDEDGKGTTGQLVDFDFCGQANQDCYPSGYKTELADTVRHDGALPEEPLAIAHDLFSFASVLSFFTPSKSNRAGRWTSLHRSIKQFSIQEPQDQGAVLAEIPGWLKKFKSKKYGKLSVVDAKKEALKNLIDRANLQTASPSRL